MPRPGSGIRTWLSPNGAVKRLFSWTTCLSSWSTGSQRGGNSDKMLHGPIQIMKTVRYTLSANTPPTATDSDAEVRHGTLGELPRGARLLPPCSPSKIVCVGRNYAEHAREFGNEPPKEPMIFLKPPSSLIASGDEIVYPRLSERVDFEGELGVVIGKRGRNIRSENAAGYIRGYTCVNDVTARDLQKKDGQWTRGKGFDTFCAVGPSLVSGDEIELGKLRLQTLVNGELKQDAPLTDMLFSVNDIIAFVSEFMTLEPGDLIATGTPPGVGPLQPGSRVQIKIEGIGVLENTVVRG
jgi:2-keto-4-pentenoate hydratase/2-oxohepta-3-ene-1,7-dioic acid hydratase in catechol pathway